MYGGCSETSFAPDEFTGDARRESDESPLEGATRYVAESPDSGLVYDLPDGALADAAYLASDFLLDGEYSAMFSLSLHGGGATDPTFTVAYGEIPQCAGRIRVPLDATDQNEWQLGREGAWCKPTVSGDRIDPAAVERIEIRVWPMTDSPVRWCQTPIFATGTEPPRLDEPALPEGPLLDEFGQSTVREWDGRTESETELVERLRDQRRQADRADSSASESESESDPGAAATPEPEPSAAERSTARDDWGGWAGREFEATGYFRVERTDDRWWLVTPDGHPFWSAGLDCVTPNVHTRYDGLESALEWLPDEDGEFADAFEHWGDDGEFVNYQVANFVRAFGPEEWRDAWETVAFDRLRRFGFNTAGNWSDWEAASEAGTPYVRPLQMTFEDVPTVYRDFPDVYHESFPDAAADLATRLEASAGDPAMIGYFLGNEPEWRFGEDYPAGGMLHATASCATRRELAEWLADRHGDGGLADAWEMDVTCDEVAEGRWDREFTAAAREDLEAFSTRMVDRLYGVVSEACRSVAPHHLNLGNRLVDLPDEWVLAGLADHVDVLTCNCYRRRPPEEYAGVAETVDAPILIGEWHFGGLDVGLPSGGLQPVADQRARGDAYRAYLERAAARPWCVGAHYFTMYDQSALGRFDGENFNIGFLNVCHRPYEPLVEAARESHERLYDLAVGDAEPYDDEPEYLVER